METPKAQELYRHFKGNLYQIITVAHHSETGELLVIYQALYGDYRTYARPLEMFLSPVDKEKYPDVAQTMRFERVDPATLDGAKPTQSESVSFATDSNLASVDPAILEFLDAETYEAKLNVLAATHFRITDEMLTTMAISCDMELGEGPTEERFEQLKAGLLKREKYECSRLRF